MRSVSNWFSRAFLSAGVLLTAAHATQAVLIPDVTNPGDPIIGIDVGGGSNFPGGEAPANAIDDTTAKYLNFGAGGSGFIVTPSNNPLTHAVRSITITTANDSEERDPATFQIFGTRHSIVSTSNSTGNAEPWTFIAGGNLNLPAGRNTLGNTVNFANNMGYTSYRVVFPGVKNAPGVANSMQLAEVQLGADEITTLGPAFLMIPVDRDGNSSSPDGEQAPNAIDGNVNTKYLNFGEQNSGFIITPTVNPSDMAVTSLLFTTANDAPERDPASYEIWGTNDEINSVAHGNGEGELWTLISTGALALPDARLAAANPVTFANPNHFESFKVIFPTVKNDVANSMQIAEVGFGFSAAAVPEPASALLGLLSVGALAIRRRRHA